MTLSEELIWRGFLEQTTLKDKSLIDSKSLVFYWGVDPSSDSMQVGNLAIAMMVKHFMKAGHKAVLLVGGATGLIGDPKEGAERQLLSLEQVATNKAAITDQYNQLFGGEAFEIVDNYDWFKDLKYLDFLRDVGKHVPMRQMLNREFVQTRIDDETIGISYAEFSYSLIQGYDFFKLFKDKNVSLQLAGSDQWGNSIAGVELVRRLTGKSVDVWTAPLIVDKSTGQKFGKSEAGVVWLDKHKTTPTKFYQFWINVSDESVEHFLKIYTLLTKEQIEKLMQEHTKEPKKRLAQKTLAAEVTTFVHAQEATKLAEALTNYLTGDKPISEASDAELTNLRAEIPSAKVSSGLSLIEALVLTKLAKSNTEAKSLIETKAVYVNGQPFNKAELKSEDFTSGRLLIRRGKAFKDSALLEV